MFPPDTAADKMALMARGLYETLEIAVIASALGILLSLPIGLLAARNLMPPWVTWPMRLLIALCRSFHPVIIAILFVKAVGFGALAGILALTVASIGFIAKLFAEAIEEISLKQVEAVRATGAPFMNVIAYGVLPQVLNRFIGFATYQLDSNLRNSTMVGIVGAGGIGGTMFAAFQRFDYDYLLTILIAIIAMIMVSEALQNWIKKARTNERDAPRSTANGAASRRAQRLARFALYFGARRRDRGESLRTVEVIPEFLYDAPEQMADLFTRMWPIEWSYYPKGVHDALIETLHIATLGTHPGDRHGAAARAARGAQHRARTPRSTTSRSSCWCPRARSIRWCGRCCSSRSSAPARSPAPWRSRSARSASSASSSARRWRRRARARSRR